MRLSALPFSIAILSCSTLATACAQSAPDIEKAPFAMAEVSSFTQPWAMTFLPDGKLLVTEKDGTLRWATQDGEVSSSRPRDLATRCTP